MDLKNINVGECIRLRVEELDISIERICNFFKLDEQAITEMYNESDLKTNIVLRWSKLLEYDFFRLYSQHLNYVFTSCFAASYQTKGKVFSTSTVQKECLHQGDYCIYIGAYRNRNENQGRGNRTIQNS